MVILRKIIWRICMPYFPMSFVIIHWIFSVEKYSVKNIQYSYSGKMNMKNTPVDILKDMDSKAGYFFNAILSLPFAFGMPYMSRAWFMNNIFGVFKN